MNVFYFLTFVVKIMKWYNGNIILLLILILFIIILLFWCINNIDINEILKLLCLEIFC